MKIIICGSLTASQEILQAQVQLEKMGHKTEIPHGVKNLKIRKRVANRQVVIDSEEAEEKMKYGVIKKYYDLIKEYDALLIVNPERKNIQGYIGGNTFLEMGFGHVLGKKIYCLNPLPKMIYTAELMAMRPTVLNGDLEKIR